MIQKPCGDEMRWATGHRRAPQSGRFGHGGMCWKVAKHSRTQLSQQFAKFSRYWQHGRLMARRFWMDTDHVCCARPRPRMGGVLWSNLSSLEDHNIHCVCFCHVSSQNCLDLLCFLRWASLLCLERIELVIFNYGFCSFSIVRYKMYHSGWFYVASCRTTRKKRFFHITPEPKDLRSESNELTTWDTLQIYNHLYHLCN